MRNVGLSCVLLLLLYSCRLNNNKPVMFHIPENFKGRFVVVYDENCGIEPVMEGDSLMFIIPESGVLILRSKFESRMLYHSYYLTNAKGRVKKLPILENYGDQFKPGFGVLCTGTGIIGGTSVDGIQPTANKDIKYEDYFVVTDDTSQFNEEKFDSIIRKTVYDCRKGLK